MPEMKSLRFLLKLAGKQRGKLFFSCLCSAVSALFALIPFVIIYWMADELLRLPLDLAVVRQLCLFALIAVLLRFVLMGASSTLAHAPPFHILYDLRVRLVDKLGRLPLGYFSTQHSGRLKKIIVDDVERIEQFIGHHLPDLTASLVSPLLTIVYLFTIDWRMAIVSLLPIPASFTVQGLMSYMGRQNDDIKRIHTLSEEMNGAIIEFVQAMPVIKSFNQTVHSFARYHHTVESYANLWIHIARKRVPFYTLFLLLMESGLLFVMPVGVWLYSQGTLTLPVLLLFLLLGVGLTAPLRQISTLTHMMQNNMEGVRRIEAVLTERELSVPELSEVGTPTQYDITFYQVRFAYGDQEVLKGVNFVAEHGKVTALVGPSGAGKSTAAQLIARFFDPTQGKILIGGIDVRSIPTEKLMEYVSFVFQDVPVINDTVAANLRMGKEDASESDLISAAQAAQAHDFISTLPNGYDTYIGEGRSRLSGGERQRLAIARAILKNAPIILLDEATASLDPENEVYLQRAISKLAHQKTVHVIAHRLKTIQSADRILVLDQGRIAESGKHEELLEKGGLYCKLWQEQQRLGGWKLKRKSM